MPPRGRGARAPREPRELDAKAAKLAAFELLAMKAWSARELIRRLRRRGASAEIARAVPAPSAITTAYTGPSR